MSQHTNKEHHGRIGNPKLSAERVSNPTEFEKRCATALKKAKGNVQEAARELEVSRRTLTRYIEQSPELRKQLRDRQEEGRVMEEV